MKIKRMSITAKRRRIDAIQKEISTLTKELYQLVNPTDAERSGYEADIKDNPCIFAEDAEFDDLQFCEWVMTERSNKD